MVCPGGPFRESAAWTAGREDSYSSFFSASSFGLRFCGLSRLNASVTPKERELALKLIDDMSGDWKPGQYHDTYREDILARVKEKVKAGQTEELTEPEQGEAQPKAEVIDLMAALRKSVASSHNKTRRRRAA